MNSRSLSADTLSRIRACGGLGRPAAPRDFARRSAPFIYSFSGRPAADPRRPVERNRCEGWVL